MEKQPICICLWFDNQAEEAVNYYTSIFHDSKIGKISRFGKEGFEYHGKAEGSVMSIEFRINGIDVVALNGGPMFKFNEAISLMVYCKTQEEIDYYWSKLTEEGEEGPCGWLKDKYGVSWQILPLILPDYLTDNDMQRKSRVEKLLFQMKKFDIHKIQEAYDGKV